MVLEQWVGIEPMHIVAVHNTSDPEAGADGLSKSQTTIYHK